MHVVKEKVEKEKQKYTERGSETEREIKNKKGRVLVYFGERKREPFWVGVCE